MTSLINYYLDMGPGAKIGVGACIAAAAAWRLRKTKISGFAIAAASQAIAWMPDLVSACVASVRDRRQANLIPAPTPAEIAAPSIVESPYAAAFTTNFLRRVRGAARTKILEKLESLKERPLSREELSAFQKGKWKHPLFADPNWPYLAIRAHMDGNLDPMQISKLFLFERIQGSGKTHQLRKSERGVDEESGALLERAFKDRNLSEAAQARIAEALVALPPEETQFFVVDVAPLLSKKEYALASRNNGTVDMYNLAMHDLNFSLFLIIDKQRKVIQQLVIPLRLYHALLKAIFPNTAMAPDPILGYCAKDRLSDPKARIQCTPCSLAPLPGRFHGYIDNANPLAMFYHDQLHLYAESGNPHRELWIQLALSFKKEDPALCASLLDRNFQLYSRPELWKIATGRDDLRKPELFWYTLPFLVTAEPGIWDPPGRIEKILRHLQDCGVPLDSLRECVQKEPKACPHSLKPWAAAAAKL